MSDHKCGSPAMYRYTWPGKDESLVCVICAMKLQTVAAAIGLHLQIIKLSEEAMLHGFTCLQEKEKRKREKEEKKK